MPLSEHTERIVSQVFSRGEGAVEKLFMRYDTGMSIVIASEAPVENTKILAVNPAFCDLTGYTPRELIIDGMSYRDLIPEDVPMLREKYGAKVGDWESASIAYVCDKNKVKLLILRGVSDLVGPDGGDAYGQRTVWVEAAERIMKTLFKSLPDWLARFKE